MTENDSFPGLPPAVAEALTRRGFTELTPVQKAVLDPAVAGRDLRIASQTGSGKTVAVGLVLAPLLAECPPKGRERNARPYALLIAPTRELAAQLARELSWLFEALPVGVAVVTGGASYTRELRALADGPEVVVATPGRLLDHLSRGSIDPSAVGAVVLDEADQMLDLGFRDDLESILERTPNERRTHLVSATFSREVLSLAERYQRNALMVEGTRLGAANSDIVHVAHLVKQHERLATLVNLLLLAPKERTLIFVRTRADAADLAERLSSFGLYALPLSGELEQRDRNRTLEAFRSGRANTLVATDVAARGLDVPDVGQVIHADPPADSEGLTHRSGRTGRAGRKGTSIMLAVPSQAEQVTRLFRRAQIKAEWLPAPGPEAVFQMADERLIEQLTNEPEPVEPRIMSLAQRLLETHSAADLVAALLTRSNHVGPCEPQSISAMIPNARRSNEGGGGDRSGRDYVSFQVNLGARDGADPRRVLSLICRRGRITGDQVGAIEIAPKVSTFQVESHAAAKFSRAVMRPDRNNPQVRIEPASAPPRRAPRPGNRSTQQRA